ncbi:hypothetical protein YC2023_036321 [Brassica napus]
MVPSENVTLRSAHPPRTKKNSGASRCLMGANLRKHNLTLMQRSPATRQQAEDNQLSTPANGSRIRHGRRPTDTSSQNNVPVDQERTLGSIRSHTVHILSEVVCLVGGDSIKTIYLVFLRPLFVANIDVHR